jgi:hypothetical protein
VPAANCLIYKLIPDEMFCINANLWYLCKIKKGLTERDSINKVCHSGLSGIFLQQDGLLKNDSGQAGMTNRNRLTGEAGGLKGKSAMYAVSAIAKCFVARQNRTIINFC